MYARDTSPLVEFYGAQGKLVGIDATGPVEDVTVAGDGRAAVLRRDERVAAVEQAQ